MWRHEKRREEGCEGIILEGKENNKEQGEGGGHVGVGGEEKGTQREQDT